jgi:hypothetical protein
MLGSLVHEIASFVALPRQGLLGISYRVTTYLNPPLGSAKCDYLFFSNEMVERICLYVSDLTSDKYYRNFHYYNSPLY